MRGNGGAAKIGNQRNSCTTCNNWTQAVRRRSLKEFKERYSEEYEIIRLRVEYEMYPKVMREFLDNHPRAARAVNDGSTTE